MENETEAQQPIIEQKSSVEISKNSRGYNWKVKVYDDDVSKIMPAVEKLECECQKKYGEKVEA